MTAVLLKAGPLGKIVRQNPTLRAIAELRLCKALAELGELTKMELMASICILTARAEKAIRLWALKSTTADGTEWRRRKVP
jgi:hypothetical protein